MPREHNGESAHNQGHWCEFELAQTCETATLNLACWNTGLWWEGRAQPSACPVCSPCRSGTVSAGLSGMTRHCSCCSAWAGREAKQSSHALRASGAQHSPPCPSLSMLMVHSEELKASYGGRGLCSLSRSSTYSWGRNDLTPYQARPP